MYSRMINATTSQLLSWWSLPRLTNALDDQAHNPALPAQKRPKRSFALQDSETEFRPKPPDAIYYGYPRHNQTNQLTIAQAPAHMSVGALLQNVEI